MPIAYARNGFTDKFGIPRQSRENSTLLTRIVFEPEYSDRNMIRGIEQFSHLWLIWQFSEAETWSATVRPPRLGGNTRVGVLATRSPFRPNHLGLTSVELVSVEEDGSLIVRGADLKDGTPIYDIKPYITFSDSHPDAQCGFADQHQNDRLEVIWNDNEGRGTKDQISPHLKEELTEILSQDPRPSYQDDPNRIYKLDYAGQHIEFKVADNTITIL